MSSLPNSTDKESADPIARSTNRKIILIFALIIVGFVFWKYYDHYIRHNYDAPCVGCSCFVPLAFDDYARSNDGWYPKGKSSPLDSLAELKSVPIIPQNFCGHGQMRERLIRQWKQKQTFTEDTTCFRYNEGLNQNDIGSLILLYYFKPTLWEFDCYKGKVEGRSIFCCDGSRIKFLPEAEFQKRQEATLKYIKDNNRVSPEKYKMLEEQYRKTLGEGK